MKKYNVKIPCYFAPENLIRGKMEGNIEAESGEKKEIHRGKAILKKEI